MLPGGTQPFFQTAALQFIKIDGKLSEVGLEKPQKICYVNIKENIVEKRKNFIFPGCDRVHFLFTDETCRSGKRLEGIGRF